MGKIDRQVIAVLMMMAIFITSMHCFLSFINVTYQTPPMTIFGQTYRLNVNVGYIFALVAIASLLGLLLVLQKRG